MVGRVGFGGFVILWPKPNPTHYKKIFITQPNPLSLKNWPNPADWVGLGLVGRWIFCTPLVKLLQFSLHPHIVVQQLCFNHPPLFLKEILIPNLCFFFFLFFSCCLCQDHPFLSFISRNINIGRAHVWTPVTG